MATRKTINSALKQTTLTDGDHDFRMAASQANADLAAAALLECGLDIGFCPYEDSNFLALFGSSEYRKIEQAYIKDAEKDPENALLTAVWRGYRGGLLSPKRMIPGTHDQWAEAAKAKAPEEAQAAGLDQAVRIGELTLECCRLRDQLEAAMEIVEGVPRPVTK
jgi:hypothetical protein